MMSDHFKRPKYIQQVDYIRAIASLSVAIFHLGGKVLPVLRYGWLGVEMFFFLSGFIICWSMPNNYSSNMVGQFVIKRVVRIEPPYIISVILALAVNYILITGYKPDWCNVALHFAYVNNFFDKAYLSPVYWTLGIEFQYYLFIAFCYPFLVKKWGVWLLVILCLLPHFITLPGGLIFSVFSFFVLGILYFLYLKGIKKSTEVICLSIVVCLISVFQNGIMETGASVFALLLLIMPLNTNSFIRFFSKISFSLYLTHDIIGSRLVVYLGKILPHSFAFKAVSFATGIIASVIFAYVFYRLIEAPFFKLSKRISYR